MPNLRSAPPVDGKANDELIRFLSAILGPARQQITIGRGDKYRDKVVEIAALDVESVCQRLNAAFPKTS